MYTKRNEWDGTDCGCCVVDGGKLQGDLMSGQGGCGKRDGLIGVVYLGTLKPYNAMLK